MENNWKNDFLLLFFLALIISMDNFQFSKRRPMAVWVFKVFLFQSCVQHISETKKQFWHKNVFQF
jgi:hypothetical protein